MQLKQKAVKRKNERKTPRKSFVVSATGEVGLNWKDLWNRVPERRKNVNEVMDSENDDNAGMYEIKLVSGGNDNAVSFKTAFTSISRFANLPLLLSVLIQTLTVLLAS